MRPASWWAEHAQPVAAEVLRLDWRDSAHWHALRKPCRLCDEPTNLRDEAARPCHKSCAETELLHGMRDARPVSHSDAMTRARELLARQNAEARGVPYVRPLHATSSPASP